MNVGPGPLCSSVSACLASMPPPSWRSERGPRARRGVEVAAGAGSTREMQQPGNGTRASGPEETAAQYAVIAIVPVFCLMGLLGILVCNLLKRKGYHCTAHKEVGPGPAGGSNGEAWPGVLVGRPEGPAQPSSPWGASQRNPLGPRGPDGERPAEGKSGGLPGGAARGPRRRRCRLTKCREG